MNHYLLPAKLPTFSELFSITARPVLRRRGLKDRSLCRLLFLALGAGLLMSVPTQAIPLITGISPQVIGPGEIVEITGSGFIADPARYSILLVDSQGLVAMGEVLAVTPDLLQAVIYGGRASNEALLMIREGVTVPLADTEVAQDIHTRSGFWFQGSGDRTVVGPVVVLPSDPNPSGSGSGHPDGHDWSGGRFVVDWPLGCSEITAKVTMGGHDPFDPELRYQAFPTKLLPKAQALIVDTHREHWQAGVTVYLTGGSTAGASAGVAAISDALNASFAVFGLKAQPFDAEDGVVGIWVEGGRMSTSAGATLIEIKCPDL